MNRLLPSLDSHSWLIPTVRRAHVPPLKATLVAIIYIQIRIEVFIKFMYKFSFAKSFLDTIISKQVSS